MTTKLPAGIRKEMREMTETTEATLWQECGGRRKKSLTVYNEEFMYCRNPRIIMWAIIILAVIGMCCFPRFVLAQGKEYPEKPIEIVIGFTPGGPIDVGTRIISEGLTKELKVPITFSYKPGAGGGLGVDTVIRAKPDGYTLHTSFNSSIINLPAMEKKPSFDPVKDLTHIAIVAISQLVMTTNKSSKFTSFDAMVKFVKQNPGKLTSATSGLGTSGQFLLEYLKTQGIDITHVPMKGATPTITGILGNHVDLALSAYSPVAPHIKNGDLRLLGVTNRLKDYPDVRTFHELGFPQADSFEIWLGLWGPPNLPQSVLQRLSSALKNTMAMPSVINALDKAGLTATYQGPEELKKIVVEDYKVIREIAGVANLIK